MKAIAYARYGPPDVLQLHDLPRPTPRSHEVLIRIYATTATAADCQARNSKAPREFKLFGLRHPGIMILGQELAGEIEAVGQKVKRFREGDQVIGWSGLRLSTYAEYISLPARGVLFIKPINMTYEEAAALPVSGLDPVYLLRKANIKRGERVLINGAGGSMGTFAVQIAKYFGAEVTGVDCTGKLDMLRSIGADHVIDYTQQDFTQSSEIYDVIFDVIGKSSFSSILNRLNLHGRYLTAVPQISQIVRWEWMARRRDQRIIIWVPRTVGRYKEDFVFLKSLVETGSIKTIIDRIYPMEQTAEAHRYIETGQKKGNVVINFR
jgi:NADPH:quinone reductase-like Zn-dependent oxidoreductase